MASYRDPQERRKPLTEMQRPRRRLGDELRPLMTCPLCLDARITVMRWGDPTTRFECGGCGLRFSIDLAQLTKTLRTPKPPDRWQHPVGSGIGVTLAVAEKAGMLEAADWYADRIDALRMWKPPTQTKKKFPQRGNGQGHDPQDRKS